MKRSILAVLLAVTMVVSLVPMTVFATGTTYTMPGYAVTVTAEFEAIGGTGSGEWFGYCTEDIQYKDSIGVGGGTSLTFAIKIPVASLPNQDVLSKVSFHTNESGTYHVRIYSTDPSAADPGTAAPDYEQEFTVSNPKQWEDVVLTTPPYVVDKTKNLWIGIESTAAYPATHSTEILETTDCCMMCFQGIWKPIPEWGFFEIRPWMIRGYFETVTPVSGGKTLPYSFDFETDPFSQTNGWTTIDADGDGYDWRTDTDYGWAHDPDFGVDESHCVMSRSYVNGVGPRNADNWLFSPAITIPAGGATVSWYEQSQDEGWPDSYTVYVSETNTSTDTSKMTEIFSGTAANPWNQRSVELEAAEYAGKTVYIAFRHQSENCYFLEIDDFAVGAVAPAHTHAFTYTANNGKITATCTASCGKGYDTTPLTLTLTAPASLVYDGNVKAFTFADGEADAWTGAGLELPTIIYYVKQSGQSTYMPLLGTLKDAGSYMAQITVNEKTAQVKFTIDKATPYIKTTPAPNDIEYGKKLSDSTLFGGYVQISSTDSSEVGGLFEWTNPDTVPGIDDSEITEYDVTFTPADTNNYNTVFCKVKIKVTHTHNPVKVTGQAATETAAGWRDYYKCDCGALFEDKNGTTPIENLDTWKAQGGAGYIPSGKEKLTVTDFDEEPVLPGAETYEVKEDGIHIYSGDIIFSGEIDEKVFIEGPDQAATFTNLVIKNSVYANNLSENVTIYMDGATIEGNVSATGNGTDDLYLCINIENDNEIKGDVTSDGSVTVYGFPNATLDVKSAKATTMLYLNGLRLENMKEEYNVESTLTATPDDASKPITFAVKKEAVFPDDEEFIINGGKPFAYGEDYNIAPPVVCDENGTPFDPQPELTVVYYEYITDGEWDWEIKALDGKPTKEGTYLITFYMPESDLYYTGSRFYEYKIGHNIQMVEGKAATTEEAGYKAYYECKGCGKFYEDASGLVEITDLAKWKAQGGNGYIAKLEKQTDPTDPTSPQTGDTSNMTLWMMLLALSSMGLCACLVLGKKRKYSK